MKYRNAANSPVFLLGKHVLEDVDLVSVNGKASLGFMQLESAVCSREGSVVVYLRGGYRCECSEFDYGDQRAYNGG